jgi:predicted glycoside hydrolase/deacetylase ChbG (UPF0249 family)
MPRSANTSHPDTTRKLLVVNADDLGLSPGINRGIFEAHERGIVTSASLMVRYPAAREAACLAKTHAKLGIGLHLDFAEWAIRDEEWVTLYEVVDLNDASAARREVGRQIQLFHEIMGRPPTHVDSHQHVHRDSRVSAIVQEAAGRLGVPLRHGSAINYCGDFYGQDEQGLAYHEGIGVGNIERIIGSLRPGVTEMACHPGYDDGLDTMYREERALEVTALCDPRLPILLSACRVTLAHFGEVGEGRG